MSEPVTGLCYQYWRNVDSKDTLTVVAVQISMSFDIKQRVNRALQILQQAHEVHGKGIYLLPEYCLVDRYDDWQKTVDLAEEVPGPSTEPLLRFAESTGSCIAIGMLTVSPDPERPYNSMAILGPDGVIGVYNKTHLWRSGSNLDRTREEYLMYHQGDVLEPYDMLGYKVGVCICADGTFPESPRTLALKGAELLLYPNGRQLVGAEAEVIAKTNLIPVVVSNPIGENGLGGFRGSSRVIGPWGEILASAVGEGYSPLQQAVGEGWAAADLDMAKIGTFKDRYSERAIRRPELYGPLTEKK